MQNQPQDITAGEYLSSISTTVFSSRFPPAPEPLLSQVTFTRRNDVLLAPLASVRMDVMLEYQGGAASHCLQAGEEIVNSSVAPCMGICETEDIYCPAKCPSTFGYTGKRKTSFLGSIASLDPADVEIVTDPLQRGLAPVNPPTLGCLPKGICTGRDGTVECTGFRVNRAGWYQLKYRFPSCPEINVDSCSQTPITRTSSIFYVREHRSGSYAVSITCADCEQPENFTRTQVVPPLRLQVVDSFGNLIEQDELTVSVAAGIDCSSNPSCAQPDLVKSYQQTSFGYKSIADIARDGIIVCHDEITPCEHPPSMEQIKRPVQTGYTTFQGLSSLIGFRSAQLQFATSNGKSVVSHSFKVPAGDPYQLRIRQQPIFGEAGHSMLFQVGVLDKAGFVIEHDYSTIVSVELLEHPGGAQLVCPDTISDSLWQSHRLAL